MSHDLSGSGWWTWVEGIEVGGKELGCTLARLNYETGELHTGVRVLTGRGGGGVRERKRTAGLESKGRGQTGDQGAGAGTEGPAVTSQRSVQKDHSCARASGDPMTALVGEQRVGSGGKGETEGGVRGGPEEGVEVPPPCNPSPKVRRPPVVQS